MSASSGPSIQTDGLVFDYDMSNTQKSFKGPPITNYISNPYASHNGSSFVNFGYNYANLGATYTYRTGVDNPINSPGVLEYYSGTSGYKYFSIDSTSLPSTTNYTFSYYARLTGAPAGGNNRPIDGQLWRANGSDRSVTGDWNPTFTNEWRRYSTTGPAEASTILQYFPVHSGNIIGGYTIQYCGFQLEVGSFATPFVVGTRSTAQAIVDLTSKNTLTVNSLTYASNNTFSFSGSNYLTLPASVGTFGSGDFTINCWWKSNGSQSNYVAIMEQGFTGSPSNGAWAFKITHNTSIINFTYYNGGIVDNLSSFNINDGAWHNYLAVRSGTNLTLYVDGVSRYSLTLPAGYSFGEGSPVFVGYNPRDGTYINGSLPVLSVYNRALSATEIQQNFNALRTRFGI